MKKQRVINLRVLPGQPLDGTGIVCIHLFVQDVCGPFVETHVLFPVIENGVQVKKIQVGRARGRLACDPRRTVAPRSRRSKDGKTFTEAVTVTPRTDDPRAVTCPACKASTFWHDLMARLESKQGV